jgi:dTDP-4-dehydrorhamnose 3,5-epimerase
VKSEIAGVTIRELDVHTDSRGWLTELFRQDELPPDLHPAMAYLSVTRAGVARGPHEHREQTDRFCFLGTAAFRLYLWDNRTGMPQPPHERFDLPGDRIIQVTIPPGVVHAYKNIDDNDGWVLNLPNRLYRGKDRAEDVDEIRHEDDPSSAFRIED